MTITVDLQNPIEDPDVPSLDQFKLWITYALQGRCNEAEVCIRIVSKEESAELNQRYRNKPYPTNVLSFPANLPKEIQIEIPLLGDLVICSEWVRKEAQAQQKTVLDHWAHLTIHGVLHLLGYDHLKDQDAIVMEKLEIDILHTLGFANPYGDF